MTKMTKQKSLSTLRRELDASEKREAAEQERQDRLRKQIAASIATRRGIVIGASYHVLPTNGQSPNRKYRAEVVAVDRHWAKREAAKHVSVLVKFYNRNGAFATRWVTTEQNEFTPIDHAETNQ